jgi:kynurenine 3-monooxygenase
LSGTSPQHFVVVGAGPAGALLSILLAQRGHRVTALERLADARHSANVPGRSINMALADRGIHALQRAGVFASVEPLLVPMRGRMLHDAQGRQVLNPYGQAPHEVIYSISRHRLTAALLDHAAGLPQVELRFKHVCTGADFSRNELLVQDLAGGTSYTLPLQHVIAADGNASTLRRQLADATGAQCREEPLAHGYKELTIAADNGRYPMPPNALHVWPRGEYMLIALPNLDGSFTATLFLPHEGPHSFASLDERTLPAFFAQTFPDAHVLLPDLARQFFAHTPGPIGSVYCERWSLDDRLLLIGDAAHAIVPFHGQGMNCAFEDCVELAALFDAAGNWRDASNRFQLLRKPNTDAIAQLALENYVEMRDTVRDPKFQLQQALALELERRFPKRFVPRYSMVTFHHEIPYAVARERGAAQQDILRDLTCTADSLAAVDYQRAGELIAARLPPLN